jgi:hypothetical protein
MFNPPKKSTNYFVLISQCDSWGCFDEHINMKSGMKSDNCNLKSASAPSLFLYLVSSYVIAKIQTRTDKWWEAVAGCQPCEVMHLFLSEASLFPLKM